MNFKTLNLAPCYETGVNDLVDDFYIPVLENAISYDRISGYFSSSSLAISAKGILGLIKNNGKMRLITSPKFSNLDIEIIENSNYEKQSIINNCLQREISEISDSFARDHLFALGWLLKRSLLEIRLAIAYGEDGKILDNDALFENGIFHQKVGVLKDFEGNIISFSGSINESARGWLKNVEEFKVFKYWEIGQKEFCQSDILKFHDFWDNKRKNVEIFNLPDAIQKGLIESAPDDLTDLLCAKRYHEFKNKEQFTSIEDLSLFDYQKAALQKWIGNDYRLICEMATGTGKTRTAIACIIQLLQESNGIIVIIACPQNTLLLQWKREIEKLHLQYDASLIVDGTNSNWRTDFENILLDISLGTLKQLIIYTTHATCSKKDFQNIISTYKKKSKVFFIGDEVHGLGASKTRNSLSPIYEYRLGLSATPRRWYDQDGTEMLYDYFGGQLFEFSLRDALNTTNLLTNKPYLVNFYYHPIFTTLTEREIEGYVELSKKITRLSKFSKKDDKYSEILENLLFKRANIHKSAENKYNSFIEILDSISDIKDTIVFVSPDQIKKVMSILSGRGIRAHEFTEQQSTKLDKNFGGMTERQFLVEKFKAGVYQVLVAIKCLDEGIDIPSAKTAILLASSTNPREYVQRLGRVLRQSPEKTFAQIYDVIIKPDYKKMNDVLIEFEKSIFSKEMVRTLEIAENSINNAVASQQIHNILKG